MEQRSGKIRLLHILNKIKTCSVQTFVTLLNSALKDSLAELLLNAQYMVYKKGPGCENVAQNLYLLC